MSRTAIYENPSRPLTNVHLATSTVSGDQRVPIDSGAHANFVEKELALEELGLSSIPLGAPDKCHVTGRKATMVHHATHHAGKGDFF